MAFDRFTSIKDYEWNFGEYPYIELDHMLENRGMVGIFFQVDKDTFVDLSCDKQYAKEILEGYAEMFNKAAEQI